MGEIVASFGGQRFIAWAHSAGCSPCGEAQRSSELQIHGDVNQLGYHHPLGTRRGPLFTRVVGKQVGPNIDRLPFLSQPLPPSQSPQALPPTPARGRGKALWGRSTKGRGSESAIQAGLGQLEPAWLGLPCWPNPGPGWLGMACPGQNSPARPSPGQTRPAQARSEEARKPGRNRVAQGGRE